MDSNKDIIYKTLLDIKEDTGKTLAVLEAHKEEIKAIKVNHASLAQDHQTLKDSHNKYKNVFLLVASGVGVFFGYIGDWIYTKFSGTK